MILRNQCCFGKNNKYYVFRVRVCSLTQAKCTHRNILPYVACPSLPDSSTLFHKWHNFGEKKFMNIKCVFLFIFFTKLSETFLILKRIQLDMTAKMLVGLHVIYVFFFFFFSDFNLLEPSGFFTYRQV